MGALYSGCFHRRVQADPVFREIDEHVRELERRMKLSSLGVEGFQARIRDPRSTFGEIANAQYELDQARMRTDELRTELELAREHRNELLKK